MPATTAPGDTSNAPAKYTPESIRQGLLYSLITYGIWGMLPLYFVLMAPASALEIVSSRVLFSLIFCAALLPLLKLTAPFWRVLKDKRSLLLLAGASAVIGVNWFVYVVASTTGHTIDASLGYFINPLVSVTLGVVFLKERLRPAQWVAVGISTVAVLLMSFMFGQVPWAGLTLAFTFGIYSMLKSMVADSVPPVVSLSLETLLLAPVAVGFMLFFAANNQLTLFSQGAGHFWLLASTGVVTAVPLIVFAKTAQLLPLTIMGMVQYLGPTIQFLLAIFVLHDPIGVDKWVGLSLIWFSLIIFSVDGVRAARSSKPSALNDPETGAIAIVKVPKDAS
ncbi:MAG: EamA family transporter RarD [Rothia sp. (in: high G+C Gram-positive bacteria)]|uniref:EamA family transporter RarD n=1 Tax=Rothia sp. (in: high G+C Gram-positive bacteria) TaxID=1885016 RepID=UPI0026DFC678|nr:EamA family transporter RarD [Rothia sp. (in: high G+C Gram-positive bacteria)]MDO5751132.1 EamA family transporter RarD [Rothia sp. (in: high G+C Gram-positive bacteria)]